MILQEHVTLDVRPFVDPHDSQFAADRALALKFAPIIRFDRLEPFLPVAAGYTVFRGAGDSPSFPRRLTLPAGAAMIIEYAIWWDWDIQHLYELEHLWVYLDDAGQVIRVEGSWHGRYHELVDVAGRLPLQNGRITVYSEPGKHAFAPEAERLLQRASSTRRDCDALAGIRGLHVTRLFRSPLKTRRNPYINWLVVRYLRSQRFSPSFDFSLAVDLRGLEPVPWEVLRTWIPQRVNSWTRRLYALLLQDKRQQLRESLDEVEALENLPPGVVRLLEPVREGMLHVPPPGLSRMLWPPVMALLTTLMVIVRIVWLAGQQVLGVLHRLGIREQTRFARFKADVLSELTAADRLAQGLTLPPAVSLVTVEVQKPRQRL
ncbi:MAG: hypothetical protein Kow0077_16150 [Anaerolineae bacterium]